MFGFFMKIGKKAIKKIFIPPSAQSVSVAETMGEKIERFRSYGIKIGADCKIYSPLWDSRDSFLLEIGNNVTISENVCFIMHDNAVIKPSKGKYTDLLGSIKIGDNCFIGFGTIVLLGVSVAENCIIGAGSVVTSSLREKNSVYAGNPARYICSIDEYVLKNKENMLNLDGLTKDAIRDLIADNESILKVR